MFDRIFARYLIDKKAITEEELNRVTQDAAHARVKLGVLAITEKLMTKEQADEVNELQSVTDKRFGDIAIEKGYLTFGQVENLLKNQGNSFLHFVQALIDANILTLEEIDEYVLKYQIENDFTHSNMDDLVSGDVIRTVNVFLPHNNELYVRLCGIAMRTYLRLIDSEAYMGGAYLVDEMRTDRYTCQKMEGKYDIQSGFAGNADSLLSVAETFANEKFGEVDLDALDAVAEFVNCVNGLFASELSYENIELEMNPPDYYDQAVEITSKELCVVPLITRGRRVEFVISIDNEVNVRIM